ncbi:hypothetical protein PPYR_00584 [Photinus pyralis]|uniref:Ubiquinone biosynthesis O-methyltransferase, mitochondrial n=1 Tax=Photinus pyralis TaxID=7054 RepID=A0A1Y1L8Q3_PHOPY|nr:ubiquinone biosynthesis O-methyltransferase, mitochondrial-like [Photinus pyralis]KAB0803614.1 hypothetical protein PPYR_00584 [Photinus pyralis]
MLQRTGRCSASYYKNIIKPLVKLQTCGLQNDSTADKTEVKHFNQIRTGWWDEMGAVKPLHSMNKLRVPLIREGLINTGLIQKNFISTPKPLTNLKILEVGCGGGILTEALARLGCCITGIDVAGELLEIAKEHSASHPSRENINYQLTTIEKFAETNVEQFDAVVASEVLEHVDHQEQFVEACVRCLKPGGSIFLTTINQNLLSWFLVVPVAESILRLVPKGTHHYDKFISPHRTQKFLEHNNCRTRLVHGFFYNVLTNTWFWTSNTVVHYAMHAVKL